MAAFSDLARLVRRGVRSNPLAVVIAVNTLIFLVLALAWAWGHISGDGMQWRVEWFSLPSQLPRLATVPWTPLTYMFTHYDFIHFLINMLWLWWFGRIFLMSSGTSNLVGLYLAGGLAGALAYLAGMNLLPWFEEHPGTLCGASAAVLAVMAAAAFNTPDFRVRLSFIGTFKLKWIALCCTLLVIAGFGGTNYGGQLAHAGGLVAGIMAGIFMHRKTAAPSECVVVQGKMPKPADAARLDEILDKIRVSGFRSLSKAEQAELQDISSRLTPPE